jgi:hypothetical protein
MITANQVLVLMLPPLSDELFMCCSMIDTRLGDAARTELLIWGHLPRAITSLFHHYVIHFQHSGTLQDLFTPVLQRPTPSKALSNAELLLHCCMCAKKNI